MLDGSFIFEADFFQPAGSCPEKFFKCSYTQDDKHIFVSVCDNADHLIFKFHQIVEKHHESTTKVELQQYKQYAVPKNLMTTAMKHPMLCVRDTALICYRSYHIYGQMAVYDFETQTFTPLPGLKFGDQCHNSFLIVLRDNEHIILVFESENVPKMHLLRTTKRALGSFDLIDALAPTRVFLFPGHSLYITVDGGEVTSTKREVITIPSWFTPHRGFHCDGILCITDGNGLACAVMEGIPAHEVSGIRVHKPFSLNGKIYAFTPDLCSISIKDAKDEPHVPENALLGFLSNNGICLPVLYSHTSLTVYNILAPSPKRHTFTAETSNSPKLPLSSIVLQKKKDEISVFHALHSITTMYALDGDTPLVAFKQANEHSTSLYGPDWYALLDDCTISINGFNFHLDRDYYAYDVTRAGDLLWVTTSCSVLVYNVALPNVKLVHCFPIKDQITNVVPNPFASTQATVIGDTEVFFVYYRDDEILSILVESEENSNWDRCIFIEDGVFVLDNAVFALELDQIVKKCEIPWKAGSDEFRYNCIQPNIVVRVHRRLRKHSIVKETLVFSPEYAYTIFSEEICIGDLQTVLFQDFSHVSNVLLDSFDS
ncbi:hypothetical protein PCE1_004467 [Barthelona sp. PCE]